jgi:hypothetical protein
MTSRHNKATLCMAMLNAGPAAYAVTASHRSNTQQEHLKQSAAADHGTSQPRKRISKVANARQGVQLQQQVCCRLACCWGYGYLGFLQGLLLYTCLLSSCRLMCFTSKNYSRHCNFNMLLLLGLCLAGVSCSSAAFATALRATASCCAAQASTTALHQAQHHYSKHYNSTAGRFSMLLLQAHLPGSVNMHRKHYICHAAAAGSPARVCEHAQRSTTFAMLLLQAHLPGSVNMHRK